MRRHYNRSLPLPRHADERGPYGYDDRADGRYWEVYPPEPAPYAPRDAYYGWDDPRYDRPLVRPDYMAREAYAPYEPPYDPYARAPRRHREDYEAPRRPIAEPSDELEERLANLEHLMRERAEPIPHAPQSHEAQGVRESRESIDTIMADLNRRLSEMEGGQPQSDGSHAQPKPSRAHDEAKTPRRAGKAGGDFTALFDKIARLEAGLSQLSGNVSTLSDALDHTSTKQNERLQNVRFDVDGLADRISEEVKKAKPDGRWFDNLEKTVADIARRQRELDGKPLPESYLKALDDQFASLSQHTRSSTQQIEGQIRNLGQMLREMAEAAPKVNLDPIAAELKRISHKVENTPGHDAAALAKLEEHLGTLALTMARVQDLVAKDIHATMRGVDEKIGKLQQTSLKPVIERISQMETELKANMGRDDSGAMMAEVRDQLGALTSAVEGFSPSGDGVSVKAMQEMRADLQRLHARLDDLKPGDLGRIEEGMRNIAERLNEIAEHGASHQSFSHIDNRLTALGEQLGAFGENLPGPEAQRAMEERLSALLGELAEARAGEAAPSAELARLEAGMKSLMENYNETKGLIGRFDRLEDGINRLIDVLADGAMATQPGAHAPASAPTHADIAATPSSFADAQEEEDDEILPVSAAMEEFQPVTPETRESWAPSLSPALREEIEDEDHKEPVIDPVEAALAEENDEYRPLEPGTGRFKAQIEDERVGNGTTARAASAATPRQEAKPAAGAAFVDQASFISAARKAAKSANVEAMRQFEASQVKKRGGGNLSGIKEKLANNRRVLIYTFAGLSILISSIVIMAPVIKDALPGGKSASAPAERSVAPASGNSEASSAPGAPSGGASTAPQGPSDSTGSGSANPGSAGGTSAAPSAPDGDDIQIIVRPKGETTSEGPSADEMPSKLVQARPLLNRLTSSLQPAEAEAMAEASGAAMAAGNTPGFDADALASRLSAPSPEMAGTAMKLPEDFGTRKLRHAVASGEPDALIEVARRYAEGEGVERSLEKAAYWYEQAAGSGNALAQYRIGSLYEKGNGVEMDKGLARLWYQRAAEQGNTKAMHNLAVMYTQGAGSDKPDFKTASQWFRRAAELGVTDSQFNLGILYGRGMGVEQDLAESYKWFTIAARNGDQAANAKRDEVYQMMDDEQRRAAMTMAEEWVPQSIIEHANFVTLGSDHWGMSAADFAALAEEEKVRRTQNYLGQIGYDAGPADGKMGPKTKEAIQSFKADMGLGNDASITLETLEMLRERASL